MKRTVISVITLVAVIAFVVGAPLMAQDDLKPKIHLPKIRHDFGKTFEQEKYEHDFVVINRGKADLIIEKVKPG